MSRDLIGDGWLSEPAIYRTDLDACRPAAALYPGSRARHWRLLSYELEGLAGTMLRADEETDAPDLTYPLRASGYHAVSLGLMAESSEDVVVLARLSGDASSTVLTCPMTDRAGRHRIRELFWKVADLSGQDLVIGQQNRRIAAGDAPGCVVGSPVRLAYVEADPAHRGGDRHLPGRRRSTGHPAAVRAQRRPRPALRHAADGSRPYSAPHRDVPQHRLLSAVLGVRHGRPALLPGHRRPAADA